MAQRVKADVAKVGIVIDLTFMSDDALNNRIYASGKTKDLYAPNYDAFLWDWDVSGTTPTPIMEVLLSNNASSDSFYASKAYDKALIGARTASDARTGRSRRCARPRRSRCGDLPYLPLVHLNAVELHRTRHLARLAPSPSPTGRPLFEVGAADPRAQAGPAPPVDRHGLGRRGRRRPTTAG